MEVNSMIRHKALLRTAFPATGTRWLSVLSLAIAGPAPGAPAEFVAKLKARPYPNRVQEDYDAAVAACK
jgi:hypothetical protein